MNYPSEFMKKRSFEVVWAVFRVAAIVPRAGIKQILEDRALGYFSHKNSEALDVLEEAIQLGSKVGDISEVNSSVLLREIGTLRTLFIEAKNAPVEKVEIPEQESIEHIFSEPPMLFADFAHMMQVDHDTEGVAQPMQAAHPTANLANDIMESGKTVSGKTQNDRFSSDIYKAPSFSGKSLANDIMESGNVQSGNNLAKKEARISGNAGNAKSTQTGKNAQPVLSSAERKEQIVSILKSKNFCNMNDIMGHFPNVSDRTLRYDIKTLADSKIVERVGNGGPNSFFRLRKKEQ